MLVSRYIVITICAWLVAAVFFWLVLEQSATTEVQKSDTSPRIVLKDLQIPWDIHVLPDESFFMTERVGRLSYVTVDREVLPLWELQAKADTDDEVFMLGVVTHPEFPQQPYVYVYASYHKEAPWEAGNAVVRLEYDEQSQIVHNPQPLLTGLPGVAYEGGRLAFGPDGYLYITTGAVHDTDAAQATDSFRGKILRLTDEGSVPASNPFGSVVYAYGLRNSQGLAWDDTGRLWAIDHGRSGVLSGMDEINLIEKGGNYGWPIGEGDIVPEGTIAPVLHSGAEETWAPASLVYVHNQLLFGGLVSKSIFTVDVVDTGLATESLDRLHKGEWGRVRTLHLAPQGDALYLTTSNTDGRGEPVDTDDRVIRVPLLSPTN